MTRDDDIATFHRDVDVGARAVEIRNAGRLQCRRGCSGCCVDDLTVFEVEADAIRSSHPTLLAQGSPHPIGRCAFLDAEGACRIYDVRPYVCRTQGLPLRWLDEEEGVESRDICELNDVTVAGPYPTLLELPEDACWTLGPAEARLRSLQGSLQGSATNSDPLARVRLRDLFHKV
ncbi:MAG: YkgJ family cysteine cluster protein [Deltaproteobacteria bacterium]|nr:YkgJ family cysteine cluster protein [Deltaproteobacteria bacterium]